MKSLTGLDATFLYLETAEMPMHVGSLNLCELPAGFRGSFHKAVKAHIGKRMHLAPVFNRKLVSMPLELGHPLWVEADAVDIDFHIRRADAQATGAARTLPPTPPMTLAEVHKRCAKLHSQVMDRNFPLWEFHVFDRIQLPASQGGKVVAGFFSKIHHAALDGKGGVMLANAMLDVGPIPREVAPPDPTRRRRREADLQLGKMIGSVFSSSLGQLVKAARSLPAAATAVGHALTRSGGSVSTNGKPRMPMKLAPQTPFNAGITAGRVFVTASVPLADTKAMGKAVGGTFNDMVLWICATALRHYLTQHHALPRKSLVAAMPVSLREADASDATQLGNQVSMTLVELGTHLAHPLKRMNAIMASTGRVKTSMQSLKGLLPTDYPSLLAPWLVGGAAKLALNAYGKSGIASRLPMVANLVISNVPGPSVPLYLAGARVLTFHPLSIIVHGLALNITIQTYAGEVDFGIVADKKALPHANDLAKAIEAAFEEAKRLLLPAVAAGPTATPVKTRAGAVPRATKTRQKATKLEATPSRKHAARRDTVGSRQAHVTPDDAINDATHGKPVAPAPRTQKKSTVRRSTAARSTA
ncbi:wax ester/triacylglycerol synthase family O-acyltransferase [Polaromonas sp. YR568]|uniref:wax ester/triacylglycerol synthase family O-acyltransferase n=1 Tax=Polaromonas sp. YR568 TaxID=1855301 RepID=UPI00313809CC